MSESRKKNDDARAGLLVERWRRRLLWQRLIGAGLIVISVVVWGPVALTCFNKLTGLVPVADRLLDLVYSDSESIIFMSLVGLGVVGGVGFSVVCAMDSVLPISRVLKVGWGLSVGQLVLFSVVASLENMGVELDALRGPFFIGTLVLPVVLPWVMLLGTGDGRALLVRQACVLGPCVIVFFGWGANLAGFAGTSSITRTAGLDQVLAGMSVAVLAVTLAILWFDRKRYARIQREMSDGKVCLYCGYDLRGTLAAGLADCPECGVYVRIKPEK